MNVWRYLALVALLVGVTCAQTPSTTVPTANTISVGADGRYEADPDTALIQFGISAQEETSKAAYDHASRSAQQVRQLLRDNGIDPKSAEIGYFSLQPVYDYRNPKRKLVGYRVNTSVTLKLHDFSKIGAIVQGLGDLDVTDNQSISYILDNMDQAKTRAAQDAVRRARSEATAVAETAGRTLGELIYASVDTFEMPRPVPMRMAMAEKAPGALPEPTAEFSAQKITVTAHVNTTFGLK
jgi:uncharacterized protein YggE